MKFFLLRSLGLGGVGGERLGIVDSVVCGH